MNKDLIEVPAGLRVADFPSGYGTRDAVIRALVIDRDAWRLTAKTFAAVNK